MVGAAVLPCSHHTENGEFAKELLTSLRQHPTIERTIEKYRGCITRFYRHGNIVSQGNKRWKVDHIYWSV
jgi:hypothetical protein